MIHCSGILFVVVAVVVGVVVIVVVVEVVVSFFFFRIAIRQCGWEPEQRTSRNGRACVAACTLWLANRPERLWPAGVMVVAVVVVMRADAGTTRCWQGSPDSWSSC